MYQARKKESKAKNVVIAILAIILALGAVGAVVGIGSKGFTQWDTSRWFKQEYGSRKVMGITKLSELEGVKYAGADDWTYVAEPFTVEIEDGDGNVTGTKDYFYGYISVLDVNDLVEAEPGTYNITVDINGNEYEFKDIEIVDVEDSEGMIFKLDHSDVEGEEIDLLDGEGKGFHVFASYYAMFNFEEDVAVEGGMVAVISSSKVDTFELVKIEKVK